MQIFWQIMQRELSINMARKTEWLAVPLFFVIVTSLFPIALHAWPKEHVQFAPIIIWVGVVLSTVLAQETILRADFKLGVFDHLILSPHTFSLLILAKIIAHWLIYCLPLLIVTPLIAVSLALSKFSVIIITASLLLGTLFLSLIAAVGAAITVRLARGGIFVAMLILPLYIPVLTLGCEIGMLSLHGVVSTGHFALLLAMVIIALIGAPLAVAAAIKVSLE